MKQSVKSQKLPNLSSISSDLYNMCDVWDVVKQGKAYLITKSKNFLGWIDDMDIQIQVFKCDKGECKT